MFEALILVCLVSTECVELTDTRGLHSTEMSCKARIAEMVSDFVSDERTPPVIGIKYKCQIKKGTPI